MAADTPEVERDGGQHPIPLIANISRGSISTHTAAGFITSLREKLVSHVLLVESGPYLDMGRNKAVGNALTLDGWDWLLFIDSDIEFSPDDIRTLLSPYSSTYHSHPLDPTSYPVIGGIYANPFDDGGVPGEEPGEGTVGPVAYEWVERDDLPGMDGAPTWAYRRLSRRALADRLPHPVAGQVSEAICSVSALGTGFLAIHRSLLEKMQAEFPPPLPWFIEPVVNNVHMGEDMGFCHRVMCMGYPVLANRSCTVLHHKTVKLH